MVLGGGRVRTVDDLIDRADAALYEAKRLGRDLTAWAGDERALHVTDPS
jgi:GGDEF domain-containing protein